MLKETLTLQHISKSFPDGDRTLTVLDDISLAVKEGEFVAIIGPSGSGKSTLLSVIGALLTPTNGKVVLDGEDISDFKPAQLTATRASNIGFIFQSPNLIPYLTVKNQLLLVGKFNHTNKRANLSKMNELVQELGLQHRLNNYPNSLSGGEKQRVAIGRAFMNNPNIILADEPTASLDYERGRTVVEKIADEVKSRRKAAIMVTHDERMLDVCDRVLHIEDGKLIEDKSSQIKNHPTPCQT
ncbi:ABC transporter ATP-binding protein [Thalassobacillus sp. CUG 92003]|uniref:ABC transporter ATP-binding protein n=1 Tax=Thalassobacillus sp. CUG 92003 TaxID=2736641 RepID=UPI0015E7BD1A|nr:ABC transporter ATP-binding protein [Thalassobacillus sp. CUG 92003]